jgi:cyanophycinase
MALCAIFLGGSAPRAAIAGAEPWFHIATVGNTADAATEPRGGIALIGGGVDLDPAFRWIIDRSDGGDVVVIRSAGDDGYNPYLFTLDGVAAPDSVTTIVFRERSAASEPEVLQAVREAEALVIAGGDQADYLALWRDTPLAGVVAARAREGMVVGGTSAGAMILGEHVYSAARGSIGSRAALRNPFDRRMTLSSRPFDLPALDGVIVDTHLSERNRQGRLLAFLARLRKETGEPVRGVGLDERTALLVAPSGEATIVGEGRALLLDMGTGADRCRRGKPLTVRAQPATWGASGDEVAIGAWTGQGLDPVTLSAARGRLREAPPA